MRSAFFGEHKRRGQVLVMVTLALFAMMGMLGLAVDLGWSYFTKKTAQAAADAAALAAVRYTYLQLANSDPPFIFDCQTTVTCQAITPCTHPATSPPGNNIDSGCLYAERNGFSTDPNGRQNVTMQSDTTSPVPTAPGVDVYYWVTTRTSEGIPQLFSSLFGNTSLASARATAAIVDSVFNGSLILLNRQQDCVPLEGGGNLTCGVDLLVQANNNQGMDAVQADGGITMASTRHGEDQDARFSGENTGGGVVRAPFTFIRGDGTANLQGGAQWILPPDNHKADRGLFTDPMSQLGGQPPPPTQLQAPPVPVPGGHLLGSNDPDNPAVLTSGSYYATDPRTGQATGQQMTLSGYIKFSSGGSSFANYVFYGGLRNQSAGTTVEFDAGRYVFAGVKPNGNNARPLFDVQVNMTLLDQTTTFNQQPNDAGEIFIFTDTKYPGLQVPSDVVNAGLLDQLKMGTSGFQTGNNADILVNLHGLNPDSDAVPQELKDFAPVVLWQDQQNSVVKYLDNGRIKTDCAEFGAGMEGCPNTDLADPGSTMMFFKASPNLHLWGVAYQPRGAFTWMVGGGGYDAPLQLIAGSLRVHANSNVRLRPIDKPMRIKVVSLIE
jgi:Flp pilus assembly protein TadG